MKSHHLTIILALALTACASKGEAPAESGDTTQQETRNDSISGSQVCIGDTTLPVSRSCQQSALLALTRAALEDEV